MINIHQYYDQTRFDYRFVWSKQAVHFGYYDQNATKHTDALQNMNRVLAHYGQINHGDTVLDAGCGKGSACFWLEENIGAQCTGVSIVKSQVDTCNKEKIRRKSNSIFLCTDFHLTPFPDNAFNIVWACESVCHSPRKSDFYKEAYRLLKPGGRLVMAEYIRTGRDADEHKEALLRNWLRPWAIPDIDTAEEHLQNATSAGFTATQLLDVTANVRVSLRNLHDISRKWFQTGKWLHKIGLISQIRLENVRASAIQYDALNASAWFYGILTAEKASTVVSTSPK